MSHLRIRTIGKLSDDWAKEAQETYAKRLQPYAKIELIELPEGHKGSLRPDVERTKQAEAVSLLKSIGSDEIVIALDETGKQFSSPDFAAKLADWSRNGQNITFLIGGSWGLDQTVRSRANETISLGKQTLPHALARVVLLEQLYRASLINAGKTYHK